jgi:hypothetical protein
MLDSDLRHPSSPGTDGSPLSPYAPPPRTVLEIEVLDARTTRFNSIVVRGSTDPMFAMARKLIRMDYDPEAIARFVWVSTGMQSFVDRPLRVLAKWTTEENERGVRIRPYRPSRLWGVQGTSSSKETSDP